MEEDGEGSAVNLQRPRRDGRHQADVSRRIQARSLSYPGEWLFRMAADAGRAFLRLFQQSRLRSRSKFERRAGFLTRFVLTPFLSHASRVGQRAGGRASHTTLARARACSELRAGTTHVRASRWRPKPSASFESTPTMECGETNPVFHFVTALSVVR